jgi:hypothetical protein
MIVGARRANDTYGFALEAPPGKSQGRPTTNSRSKRIEQDGPAQPSFAPGCPASRTVAPYFTGPEALNSCNSPIVTTRRHLSPFIPVTNIIERLDAELDRRAKVVGIFPNRALLLRLATAVLQEHDEWQDGRKAFSQTSM